MKNRKPNICHIRLINGDEILCEVVKNTAKDVTVRRPMVVSEKTDAKTKASIITMSRYVMFNGDTDTKIQKPHVVTMTTVLNEFQTYYFNSIEYNSRFVEPQVLDQIAYVNEVMESALTDPNETFDEMIKTAIKSTAEEKGQDAIRTVYLPANNSIH